MAKKITDKQERFVQEYLIDLNATQAAIRAGYSKKTARQIGQQNLSKVVIQNLIQSYRSEQKKKFSVSFEDKQRMLLELAQYGSESEPIPRRGQKEDDEVVYRQRNPSAAVAAIRELNMMDGDHAATNSNVHLTGTDNFSEYAKSRGQTEGL